MTPIVCGGVASLRQLTWYSCFFLFFAAYNCIIFLPFTCYLAILAVAFSFTWYQHV